MLAPAIGGEELRAAHHRDLSQLLNARMDYQAVLERRFGPSEARISALARPVAPRALACSPRLAVHAQLNSKLAALLSALPGTPTRQEGEVACRDRTRTAPCCHLGRELQTVRAAPLAS